MSYAETVIDQFQGLDLADDPEEIGVGAAVDLLDVDVTTQGRLRTRDGTVQFAASNQPPHSTSGLPYAISVGYGGELLVSWVVPGASPQYLQEAFNSSGASVATANYGYAARFVRLGTPSARATYFSAGGGIRKWNGSAFSSVTTSDSYLVGITPTDNRLVNVSAPTAAAGLCRVQFSDPGAPETFSVNNYVDLDPGDGEDIIDVVTWRDRLFVFKRTKLFVFTGTATGPIGNPIFNYYPVRSGIAVTKGPDIIPVATGPDGVYFIGMDGIYRTTGELPVKVSAPLDPWFQGVSLPLSPSLPSRSATGPQSIAASGSRVFYRQGTRTFVLHVPSGRWTLYGLPVYSAATDDTGLLAGISAKVVRMAPTYTTDDGTAIDWSYRTGVTDLGAPVSKLVKQIQVWGTGNVSASVYADHGTTDAGTSTLALGSGSSVVRGQQFYSRQGTFFGLGLSGTGPAVVHRAVLGVAEQRLAGVG